MTQTEMDDEARWQDKANCRGLPPEAFFFEKGDPAGQIKAKNAIRICMGCEVRLDCFMLCAVDAERWRYGVWGGTTTGIRRTKFKRQDVIDGKFDPAVLDKPMAYAEYFADLEEQLTA